MTGYGMKQKMLGYNGINVTLPEKCFFFFFNENLLHKYKMVARSKMVTRQILSCTWTLEMIKRTKHILQWLCQCGISCITNEYKIVLILTLKQETLPFIFALVVLFNQKHYCDYQFSN